MVSVTIIIASALGATGFSAAFAVALGRAAALADRNSDRMLAERRVKPTVAGYRQSYAGFARAQSTITREMPGKGAKP